MKRLSIIMTAVIAFALQASAQFYSSDNHRYWGVRASYELAIPGDLEIGSGMKADMYGNGSGFNIGAVYNIPVVYNFYFEPGVNLAYNTWSINKGMVEAMLRDNLGLDPDISVSSASARMWDIRVPLMGGYHFDFFNDLSISVFTGPELSMGINCRGHYGVGDMSLSQSYYGKVLNRFDVKWRFGAGVTFRKHYYASVSGAVGMCDRAHGPGSMRSDLFDITLGYNF